MSYRPLVVVGVDWLCCPLPLVNQDRIRMWTTKMLLQVLSVGLAAPVVGDGAMKALMM